MNRKDFGKLITTLRREHGDEEDVPWTQHRLAQEANQVLGAEVFTEYMIGSIERGRRAVDEQTLLALATALQLTSGERKEFFLAASGIDNENIAREENDPEEVLSVLLDRMKQAYLPAYIIDSYCDVVAINPALIELRSLASDKLGPGGLPKRPFPVNLAMFVFSDDVEKQISALRGEDWSDHAYQTMMVFRTWSLRYRTTAYFQALLQQLKRSRLFRRYWRDVYLREGDHFVDNRHMFMNSPKWGPLAYFSTYFMALTTVGELRLCVYVPAGPETADVFSQIMKQPGGTDILRVGAWPSKKLPEES